MCVSDREGVRQHATPNPPNTHARTQVSCTPTHPPTHPLTHTQVSRTHANYPTQAEPYWYKYAFFTGDPETDLVTKELVEDIVGPAKKHTHTWSP